MSSEPSRPAYKGNRRKIVLAFDIGTTCSGISYSILEPGQCPSIHAVTRFPAQEVIAGASKVPTVVYYDKEGSVKAIGAEAIKDGIYEKAIEGNWYKAECGFKLHLRSKYTSDINLAHNIPPLPPNKTVVDVFADYIRYLLDCSASYIKGNHLNGHDLWNNAKGDIHFVLSHPNGWEGKEQSKMRKAVVKAGLVPDNPSGHSRITFVTEGEASLHFVIENGVLSHTKKGQGIVIIDAGGGTIDASTYKRVSNSTRSTFEEISIAQCYFQGSVFVTLRAGDFKDLLVDSPYLDDFENICDCFDKTTKTRFRNASEPQYVKFGSTRDNDASCNIRFGQLKVAGAEVAKFFQPSIDCIIQVVLEQKKTALKEISHVILVGGFAASDYLFEQVEAQLNRKDLVLLRPESRVNKAVSDGAISFFLDHHVRTRVAKVSYGTDFSVPYNRSDPEHLKRPASKFINADGSPFISGVFNVVLPKNAQVSETKEFSSYFVSHSSNPDFRKKNFPVMCYRGSQINPKWIDTDPVNFTTLCEMQVDLSHVPKIANRNPAGDMYYTIKYELVLIFGLTELQAQLRWFKHGAERRSPAQLIYDYV